MPIVKQSFISNIIGYNNYEEFVGYAKIIIAVGTCMLIVVGGLSYYFHSSIINRFLQLLSGTSLLFIVYVAACILLLDIRVEVEKPEQECWEEKKEISKPMKYKLTIVWGIVLVMMGIAAIYFSNKYKNQYDFECTTFLVDHKAHVYHLDWNDNCGNAENADELKEMYGYEIDDTYSFCKGCKEYEEDLESEADD